MLRVLGLGALLLWLALSAVACGDNKQESIPGDNNQELILGATTSVQDAGLLDPLVKAFEDRYGYAVKPIVGGSGQILEQGRQGEIDVIMTHSPSDEKAFIDDGFGLDRAQVMQNFFLIAGPRDDPAGIKEATAMEDAFQKIAGGEHAFVSRGDNSGTHRREQSIWEAIGLDPIGKAWYTESATGQGQNLLVANDGDAYTLVDSSTFVAFGGRVAIVELLRDEERPNIYSVIRLNVEKLNQANVIAGHAWRDFVLGEGQEIIATIGREEYGEPLFESLGRVAVPSPSP
jgi:tungstate transport system substrate-binding protein